MPIESGKSATPAKRSPIRRSTAKAAATSSATISHSYNTESKSKPAKASRSKPWQYTKRGYALARSFQQLRSQKLASIVTLLVFGVTLALPALILFTASSLSDLGSRSVGEESITAYLTLQTSDLDGASLAQQVQLIDGVKEARYVSKDEALALFYAQTDIDEGIDVLGENPLPGSIILFPDTSQLNEADLKALATTVAKSEGVDRVQFDLRWVQRLQAVLNLTRSVGWILASFLTLTALLVIGNTIRLELLRRQTELDVSRLLGANKAFLNRPVIYTGALYGFLGGCIACAIALFALHWLREPAVSLSSLYSSTFELVMPTASQLLLVVLAATILGVFAAIITLYQPSNHFLQNRRTGI